jgi:hypothetical protein
MIIIVDSIEVIHISGMTINPETLDNFPSTLQILEMVSCRFLSAGILHKLPRNLHGLNISECTGISEIDIQQIPRALVDLTLPECLTEKALPELPQTLLR